MSLTDALLLESTPAVRYIALRTDGAQGDGSEENPWNGARANYPTLNISAVQVSLLGAGPNYLVRVDTVAPHGFSSDEIILMSGFAGADGELLNGSFKVTPDPDPNLTKRFTYTVIYAPLSQFPPPGLAPSPSGVTCQRDPFLFDAVMRALPTTVPLCLNLGPGVFETKGYQHFYRGSVSWMPFAGLKLRGAGIGLTTLKLAAASYRNVHYHVIGMPPLGDGVDVADGFEAADFGIDCAVGSQFSSQLTCGAVSIRGSHTRLRRLRAIHYGRQGPGLRVKQGGSSAEQVYVTPELFVFSVGGSSWKNNNGKYQSRDCVIEDCVCEEPGLNSIRESTMMIVSGSDVDAVNRMPVPSENTVFRRNYINCEYQNNPSPITNVIPVQTTSPSRTEVTVTTATPHGLVSNDWARVSGVKVPTTTASNGYVNNLDGYSNPYNGSFPITRLNDTQFKYVTTPSAPQIQSFVGAWLNRWPSDYIKVASVSPPTGVGNGNYEVQITTLQPHFLIPKLTTGALLHVGPFPPGCIASLDSTLPKGPDNLNLPWVVTSVVDNFTFYCERNFEDRVPTPATGFVEARIGAKWQGMTGARVIEDNYVHSCAVAGQYVDSFGLRGTIVRRNRYSRVRVGMFMTLQNVRGNLNQPDLPTVRYVSNRSSGSTFYATFEMAPTTGPAEPHSLSVGQGILLKDVKSNDGQLIDVFNRSFKVIAIPTPAQLEIQLDEQPSAYPSSLNRPEMDWLWVSSDAVFEGNVIEILPGLPDFYAAGFAGGVASSGVNLEGDVDQNVWNSSLWAPPRTSPRDFYRYLKLLLRENQIRYAMTPMGAAMSGFPLLESGMILQSVERGGVTGNTVDLAWRPDYTHETPIIQKGTNLLYYFGNASSGGSLIPGTVGVGGRWSSPVEETVEEATLLSFL